MNIGKVIKKLRRDADMTQRDLAVKLSVTVGTISFWELGYCDVPAQQLARMADIFKVQVQVFFNDVSYKEIQNVQSN